VESAWDAVKRIPAALRRGVAAVGATGQMHGVVVLDKACRAVTPLVTWEDQRCLEGVFLRDLKKRTGYPMRTGFGCATLAWYAANGKLPRAASSSCTIHDLVVAQLCGLMRPVTDASDAASWGLFDLRRGRWDARAVRAVRIPARVLPRVLPCGAGAGRLAPRQAKRLGLPPGIPVAAALGDNQASVFAALDDPEKELALNIGTGAQVTAVLWAGAKPARVTERTTYDCRPFPGGRFMLVAPSLAGGSAWAWLAETVERWCRDAGAKPPSRERIYGRMNALGLAASDALTMAPHFLGERYDASLRASISNINLANFGLGDVARALARGLVENMKSMLPKKALVARVAVVGSGNALRLNPLLQEMTKHVFGLPLRLAEGKEEAARGAALIAASCSVPARR
jgi:sedoheptulokinase